MNAHHWSEAVRFTLAPNPAASLITLVGATVLLCTVVACQQRAGSTSPTKTPQSASVESLGTEPPQDGPEKQTALMPVVSFNYPAFIVPAAAAVYPGDFFAKDISGHFTPTQTHVERFEDGLRAHLAAHPPPRAPNLHARYQSYGRQYLGLVMQGRERLYVNFSCRPRADWSRAWAETADGGDCYFQVLWDVKTGDYVKVSVNGVS